MFDVSWAELMVIGVVALIVIGPRDLPEMFRQLGRFTAKLRSMSRDFQRAMDQAARDSGMQDVAKDLKAVTSPKSMGLDAVKGAADKFEKWDPLKGTRKPAAEPLKPPPMPATPAKAADADAAPEPAAGAAAPAAAAAEGPATQALRARQEQKKAILRETAAKLKAVDAEATVAAPSAAAPAAPAARPKATRRKTAAAPAAGDATPAADAPKRRKPGGDAA